MSLRFAQATAVGLSLAALACDSSSNTNGNAPSTDGGAEQEAGPRITNDGGGGDDAGAGGGIGNITCGGATCALPQEHCCTYNNDKPPPSYLFACVSGALCPPVPNASDAVALSCASAANCAPGTVCCLYDDLTPTHFSKCVALDACKDDGDRVITAQLCDPSAMVTGCPVAAPCSNMNVTQWNLPPGYATCGGKGL